MAAEALEGRGANATVPSNLTDRMRRLAKGWLGRPEKIFCIGLGKTGTTTFGHAMRTLGYRHRTSGVTFAFQQKNWFLINRAIKRYDSFDDFPWPYLYEEIVRHYPNAQFVLTTRASPERWIESLKKHYAVNGPTITNKVFYGYFSPFDNVGHHVALYEGHNDRVRRYFAGRPNFVELCWERGDGWKELCGFLGRRLPDAPFPHANSAPAVDYDQARAQSDTKLAQMLSR